MRVAFVISVSCSRVCVSEGKGMRPFTAGIYSCLVAFRIRRKSRFPRFPSPSYLPSRQLTAA